MASVEHYGYGVLHRSDVCVDIGEALPRYGRPGIFNTHQDSQFTSPRFIDVLTDTNVRIVMNGYDGCVDDVFIERLWRTA